ncbi:hypothetical protein CHLRE_06g306057v5 [Chlamydomonas reinhardtii]|uniref:Uncharacterized protein n=1 Tax=Chlamydomonas reinhardtii TaxID=3055 RepID=A0A2K3DRE8_CHLRE|nr:uncharacterized protein CHLRE_06g306057v5 [Chlamydomonas reinhardtii]PNW83087.1 hypothetical protein CHLRE_06g306057v5 [Chlamydomonas reinhardtii]
MNVTDAGVRQLSALTCLSRLVLRDTVEVSGDTLAVLLPTLKELQVLDIQRNWSFNNVQLARCLPALAAASNLCCLDLRASWVTDEGVAALGRLPGLRRLALSPQHEHWAKYLHVLPGLTGLTGLVMGNLPSVPYQLVEALAALPNLRELDMSEPPPPLEGAVGWAASAVATATAVSAKEPLRPFTVAALARLSALRHLDLSRRHVLPDQALFLAVCMPSLERITLVQCGLAPSAVARLWQQRPCLVVISSASAAAYMGGGGGGGGVCGGEGLGGGGGAGDGGSGEGGVGGAGGGSKVMGYGLALAAPAGGGGGGGGGGGEGLLLEEVEAGAGAGA